MMKLEAPILPTVPCEYCGAQVQKRDLKHHQSFECIQSELRILQCPKGCGENIQARHLDQHVRDECPLELVPCEYQLIGCPRRIQRRARKEHNAESMEYHLSLMNKSSQLSDERMATLEKAVRARETELSALQRTLDEERKDRLDMMQTFQEKIQILLDVFEEKLNENNSSCQRALKGAKMAATTVDSVRRNVDGLTVSVRNLEAGMSDMSTRLLKGQAFSFNTASTASSIDMINRTLDNMPLDSLDSIISTEPQGAPVTTLLKVHIQNGPYFTISDALLDAKVGDKIVVSPGRYNEALRINKPVQIIGDGHVSDVIIETNGKDTIIADTDYGVLSRVTLRQKGDGFWSCVDIVAGQFNLEACDVCSKSLTCISIHRKDSRPRLWRNRIHDCGGTGVFVFDGAKAVIEDNDIYENGQSGIEITEGADPEIKFNRIRGNAQHGILVHDNGKGVITDNEIFKNSLAGIEIRESGNSKIHRNKIYSQETSGGIYIHHYARADIEKNDVYQNALAGIVCWQSGKPICRLNRVTKNGEHGIHVKDGGWGTYEDNDLRSNGRGSLLVAADCTLKVILNRNVVD